MFDMSWGEVLVISTVALVAIGPKELPKALRMAGQVVGKVRRMAGEFQAQFNEAMREADLEELRKTASDINDAVTPFKSSFDPLKSANEQLQKAIGLPELPELPESSAIGAAALPEAGALGKADKGARKTTEKSAPKARAARRPEPKSAPSTGKATKPKSKARGPTDAKTPPAAKPVKAKATVSKNVPKQAEKSTTKKKPANGKA